jgi:uncharacterized NAD(P)/FAD-binding protein YdhS
VLSGPQPVARRAERPSAPRRPTVAIVGAGASGTLVATHLLRDAARQRTAVRAVLIDRRQQGGGVAYSTSDPNHRLNVAAARMSAFPDEPDDFVDWRAKSGGGRDPGAYAPRGEYRRYLAERLRAAQSGAPAEVTLARLVAPLDAVEPLEGHVRLRFADGATLDADLAVLALGNPAATSPQGCAGVCGHAAYVQDPWAPGALDELDPATRGRVLLIGSGLTMVDVAMTVTARCPQAQVLAISRHGLLPRAHLPGVPPQPAAAVGLQREASFPALVEAILAEATAGRPGWHKLVDDLRPATQELWRRLAMEERERFLASHHRAWCVHRHRMPPQVAAMLADLLQRGRLQVRGGSAELQPGANGSLEATVSGADRLAVSLAVNCTGPGLDPRASEEPLVRGLLRDGHASAHPLGIGFDTAPDGAFRSHEGAASRVLFTLGPPRIGELYETTAIPEIREQAQELARLLVARLTGARRSSALGARSA